MKSFLLNVTRGLPRWTSRASPPFVTTSPLPNCFNCLASLVSLTFVYEHQLCACCSFHSFRDTTVARKTHYCKGYFNFSFQCRGLEVEQHVPSSQIRFQRSKFQVPGRGWQYVTGLRAFGLSWLIPSQHHISSSGHSKCTRVYLSRGHSKCSSDQCQISDL